MLAVINVVSCMSKRPTRSELPHGFESPFVGQTAVGLLSLCDRKRGTAARFLREISAASASVAFALVFLLLFLLFVFSGDFLINSYIGARLLKE